VLLVLSDMEFEEAKAQVAPRIAEAARADEEAGGRGLLLRATRTAFASAGYGIMPHVVFWQLRSGPEPVFQADALEPGVSFVSGFSAGTLRMLLQAGAMPCSVTAWSGLMLRLGDSRYDAVREVVAEAGEVERVAVRMTRGLVAGAGADAAGPEEDEEDERGEE